jgi:hypothetical protein
MVPSESFVHGLLGPYPALQQQHLLVSSHLPSLKDITKQQASFFI